MPLYEYACTECGHRFELLQKMGEGPENVRCPECRAEKVEKQFSTFASAGSGDATSLRSTGGCGAPGGFT